MVNLTGVILVIFNVILLTASLRTFKLSVSQHDITVLVDFKETFSINLEGAVQEPFNITLKKQHTNLVDVHPSNILIEANLNQNNSRSYEINVIGLKPGHLEVTAESSLNEKWISKTIFVRVTVAVSEIITYVSIVFGWIYFLAWSVSFYPQIYINYKRKSVVGLNFDFLSLNIVGFILYSVFNIGLYWVKPVQDEYFNRHPKGLNPVLINDVFFSIHAAVATLVTIGQCFIYERGDQRVSITARGLLGTFLVIIIITIGLVVGDVFHIIDFLYFCSYIKLFITLIKYVPQAIMNYRRKSTVGWSIGNILLDFTGGMLSMLQMMLNAHNYDDWESIFGDPTKFGLGLFSVCFDIFFMLQHYVFYRESSKEVDDADISDVERLRTLH